MDVFAVRDKLIEDYRHYAESFLEIKDERIRDHVAEQLSSGLLWPDPPLQLNPAFESGGLIDELVTQDVLDEECSRIFRVDKEPGLGVPGRPLRLHRHQADAIRAARSGSNYVLTTGTGSGKSLSYIVPIVDHVLRTGPRDRRVKAIVVYPMNALANSQAGELEKFLCHGYPDGRPPVSFRRYTGQESDDDKRAIRADPPDILLTNYVMLEYILTRPDDRELIEAAQGLAFLVLDELHTYRGRQGADVALLVRRLRNACSATDMRVVGTSATMAGPGTLAEQRTEVAAVASRLFGTTVPADAVIGETLRSATADADLAAPAFVQELTARVQSGVVPQTPEAFIADPLARWIERTFGVRWSDADQRLERCPPLPLGGERGATAQLARMTGVPLPRCEAALRETLLAGSRLIHPATGFPIFAFRLHQFVSGGTTVSASLDAEGERAISTSGQQFVPGEGRGRALLPLVFCRECGQEYYCVRERRTDDGDVFEPRELSDRSSGPGETNGFLYLSTREPWPADPLDVLDRVPPDWLDPASKTIKPSRRGALPSAVVVDRLGRRSAAGIQGVFVDQPFRFCLSCGVAYGARLISDFTKLATVGAGGRSTSTTILGLSAVRSLRAAADLPPQQRKLLSFSDNRQDASLQAGHFNDFVEVGMLRSALFRAAVKAGDEGLTYTDLAPRTFAELELAPGQYASKPELKGGARMDTDRAMHDVLAYRLYRDGKRWRITSPNLEQAGLLRVDYAHLGECCRDEEEWERDLPDWLPDDGDDDRSAHAALAGADPATRGRVARVLLDYMRRELAVKVDQLDRTYQEGMRARSSQHLVLPWALDDQELLVYSSVLYPRPRSDRREDRTALYLSPRGAFGLFLRRAGTFAHLRRALTLDETARVIASLLAALRIYGLVETVGESDGDDPVPAFQLVASELRWRATDGRTAYRDELRVPQQSSAGGRTNPFFVSLYREIAATGAGIQAREHTAQVKPELREEREDDFRDGRLPIMFCSPTMELGVDIASLNVVNMRNVPPTPANYAQRSGRAGRSGQPALVYTFCSSWNSHDQYFFRRPHRMVSGQVAPPALDLANEDLVREHVHAIWLAATDVKLGASLVDVLDVDGDPPTLDVRPHILTRLEDPSARRGARARAVEVLAALGTELDEADWYDRGWLDRVLDHAHHSFDRACDRWRGLYRAALASLDTQNEVIRDASKPAAAKRDAQRLWIEAKSQLELLQAVSGPSYQSDFYSYRYLASEGFLPGYNFPRLPLSAYIPARRTKAADDEFLSRPRFLAISEFGPRAIVYHEGARYECNKVILPPAEEDGLPLVSAKLCARCGHLHEIASGGGPDLCERCGAPLAGTRMEGLLRMQNVATRRRDRISSDEEERQRQGYEIRTGVRFEGAGSHRRADVTDDDGTILGRLDFGAAATLWRVNLGWARRAERDVVGFGLDTRNGFWKPNEQAPLPDSEDPANDAHVKRVIPFVEDRRNCLLLQPGEELDVEQMASLQAALKRGIQATFQLEDQELSAEPLPDPGDRRLLLFFESAEGGAGVLRRLLEPAQLAAVAREALAICHFDPDSGADLGQAEGASERCESACYDCLLSYGNQRDHLLLVRESIRDILLAMARGTVTASGGAAAPTDHIETLRRLCDSALERRFLDVLIEQGRRLPSTAQKLYSAARSRPDFVYEPEQVAVFIDGPHHEDGHVASKDAEARQRLEWEYGMRVVVLAHDQDWTAVLDAHPDVFGARTNGA